MIYQQMVIKDDRIEVVRKDATNQPRPIKCPYAQWNNGNCHPDCLHCGDYKQIPRYLPNDLQYVDHVGIAIHLSCCDMDLICEHRSDFADLRTTQEAQDADVRS